MYAVVDVETTGGSASQDRIIEIAVYLFDGEKTIERFETLLNPGKPVDPYITKLTGITTEMVQGSPTFADVHQKILELTHEAYFVAHNVKFDFGMLRHEFKRLGIDFNRRQLDTVTLARKTIPGYDSYSLGNICESLGINITDRHRAGGDTEATVELLKIILSKPTASKYIEIELNHGIDVDLLPPYISKAEIEKLPEEAGVYYYKDEVGKVLFMEGVKSIRKKVINRFQDVADTPDKKRMYELMRSIDYELTGNELTAKLLAHREVKQLLPEFNKKPKLQPYTHAIFLEEDEAGFSQLKIHPIEHAEGVCMLRFTSKVAANKVLAKIIRENNLHGWFALRGKMKEKGIDAKAQKNFNKAMEKAVRKYLYRQPSFFIVGEGIHPEQNAVVCIENNEYKGYGYFTPELDAATVENMRAVIKPDEDDFEVHKIIRTMLKKVKNLRVIPF